jgi:hypothetical protein
MNLKFDEINEDLPVSDDQFAELVSIGATSSTGYWLLGIPEWNLLAIGLNIIPGGFELALELDLGIGEIKH